MFVSANKLSRKQRLQQQMRLLHENEQARQEKRIHILKSLDQDEEMRIIESIERREMGGCMVLGAEWVGRWVGGLLHMYLAIACA